MPPCACVGDVQPADLDRAVEVVMRLLDFARVEWFAAAPAMVSEAIRNAIPKR